MNEIAQVISTLGFPIVACCACGIFIKYMIDQQNKNIERLFAMYEQANKENREAIEANTKVIEKLCDKLDKEVR